MTDDRLARLIRDDRIDILVDLTLHARTGAHDGVRAEACARFR